MALTLKVGDPKVRASATVWSARLKQCWERSFDWELLPRCLREVCLYTTLIHLTIKWKEFHAVFSEYKFSRLSVSVYLDFIYMASIYSSHNEPPYGRATLFV